MTAVFSDLSTTRYHTPGHPEAPERVSKSYERLKAAGLSPQPPSVAAVEEDVSLLHDPAHFKTVKEGRYSDPDTPHHVGIEGIALTSLSGALSAAQNAAKGDPAFSLMRPPGHHAGKSRVAGFCYFNNLALACQRLMKEGKAERVAVVDVDVHHGDGTEELFSGRDDVLFASLHQVPLYPGTGMDSRHNCFNFPLPPGTGEAEYLRTLEKALEGVLLFKPDILAVSAGFDTYKDCPIAGLKLEKATYRHMGWMLSQTRLRRFAVLEGGYAADLPVLVENFLDGFFA